MVNINFLSANIRASLFVMLSMMGFVVNDMLVRTLDGALPVGQIMAVRGGILTCFIVLIAWHQQALQHWRQAVSVVVLRRSFAEGMATVFFLIALMRLPFANVSAILQALPLAVTFGAALFLGEPVGWRRWVAIMVGFCGVLLIIRPGAAGFQIASVFALISVVFAATRDLLTRTLPPKLPSILVSAATSIFITLLGTAMLLFRGDWQPMSSGQIVTLGCAAVFLFFGYQFIVLGMRHGEIAYVVPFRYTSLLWAIGLGFFVFDEIPDLYTMIGSAIVVLMGLFTLYREISLRRVTTGRRAQP